MKEIWKDILDFEGYYKISNLCRIKSVDRYVAHYPNGFAFRKGKILKTYINKKGYVSVVLKKENKKTFKLLHRLMYETFIGKIPEGMQINHINEDKTDNRLSNLNLMSCKENINWGTHNERMIKNRTGNRKPKPILQCDIEGNIIKEWFSANEVKKQLGYSQGNITSCCLENRNKAYGYIWKYKYV